MRLEIMFVCFLIGSLILASTIFGASFYWRSRLNNMLRRIIAVMFYSVLFGVASLAGIYFLTERTIVEGKQCQADRPKVCWGYSVKEYPYRDFCTLSIWYSWRLKNEYSFPSHINPPTVKDEKWLANGTAIYLNLAVNKDNSAKYELPMRLVYDFESGDMFAQKHSADWLNSTMDSRNTGNLHLSEEEFAQVIFRLENVSGSPDTTRRLEERLAGR